MKKNTLQCLNPFKIIKTKSRMDLKPANHHLNWYKDNTLKQLQNWNYKPLKVFSQCIALSTNPNEFDSRGNVSEKYFNPTTKAFFLYIHGKTQHPNILQDYYITLVRFFSLLHSILFSPKRIKLTWDICSLNHLILRY